LKNTAATVGCSLDRAVVGVAVPARAETPGAAPGEDGEGKEEQSDADEPMPHGVTSRV